MVRSVCSDVFENPTLIVRYYVNEKRITHTKKWKPRSDTFKYHCIKLTRYAFFFFFKSNLIINIITLVLELSFRFVYYVVYEIARLHDGAAIVYKIYLLYKITTDIV